MNDITPLPTNAANPLVASNLSYKSTSYYTRPSVTFRVDHVFTQNTRAYVRYTENIEQQNVNSFSTIAADGLPAGVSGISANPDKLYAYAVSVSHVFSATFFSETTLSQNWFAKQDTAGPAGLTDFAPQLGMPDNFGEPGFPAFKDILSPLAGTQTAYSMTQTISTAQEHMTKIVGINQLLFGVDDRYEHFGSRPDERQNDALFNGQDTALENPASGNLYTATTHTGYADADEFLGGVYDYTYNLSAQYQHINDNSADAYLQDNLRIRPNLTLNLGLRYEAHPAITTSNGEMLGFDLANDAVVLGAPVSQLISEGLTTQAVINNDMLDGVKFESASQAGYENGSLLNSYNFTWGPRFGIAWLPFSSRFGTVIRGGLGRYIYPEPVRSQLVDIVKNNPFAASYAQDYTAANQAPDSLPNYLLRSQQPVTLGVNSANVVNTASTTAILPGIVIKSLDPYFAPNYVTEANVTIEQPLKWNTALRMSYVFTRGVNVNQAQLYNNHPSSYAYEIQTGNAVPTGSVIGSNQYAATATGPYDQTTYGGNSQQIEQGWSNYNALQVNYQKLYHGGVAFQFAYVFSKLLDTAVGSSVYPYANYVTTGAGTMTPAYGAIQAPVPVPGLPAGVPNWGFYHAIDRFQNYGVDTGNPMHSIKFNGILDFPFGRGKHFFSNTSRVVNEVIGGWQIAGSGNVTSQNFALSTANFGPANPLQVYKKSKPVTDCRSGVCEKDYLWFNGYIPATVIAGNACSTAAAATGAVVNGIPSNYIPYQSPIDTGCSSTTHDTYYGDNEVNITLANGKTSAITYSPGPAGSNAFSRTVVNGPFNYSADLSLFKVFPITERIFFRVNMDVFNAFNIQGLNNPSNSSGLVTYQAGGVGATSENPSGPREVQITARLTF